VGVLIGVGLLAFIPWHFGMIKNKDLAACNGVCCVVMALLGFCLDSASTYWVWKAVAFLAAFTSCCYIVNDDLESKVGDVERCCGLIMLLTLSGMSTIKLFDVRQCLKWISGHQIHILARHGSPGEEDGIGMTSRYQSTDASQNLARKPRSRNESQKKKEKKTKR